MSPQPVARPVVSPYDAGWTRVGRRATAGEEGEMARKRRYGLCIDQNLSWPDTVERWRYFEELGYDSLWNCDHFIQPSRPTGPYVEGWTQLAGLAAVTARARIGVLVSCNTFRHPALLAKQAVTVDHISGGRLDLGLGAGWYEPEHAMFGIPFPEKRELVDRFREAVELVDGYLRNDVFSYAGRHYQLTDATCRPGPLQQPRMPLMLGAHGPRMLGIVARHADAWSSHGTVEQMRERNVILDEHCARIGRNPDEISRSLYGWAAIMPEDPWVSPDAFAEVAARYHEVGVNELIVDAPGPDRFDVLERVASDVLPRLRDE
jgi:alkanesulfonate monooxygenase SsuD/methylene tetrahydromethanopterin reductase-like flavin-dependent oxidoreductase (luciferase family)